METTFYIVPTDNAAPGTPAPPSALPEDLVDWRIPCEVYSRIVGYLRPVQDWNAGKRREFEDRVVFDKETVLR